MDHASLRAQIVTDAGRLRAFSKMRGALPAMALRMILMARSGLRAPGFAVAGVLTGNDPLLKKAGRHFVAALVLMGVADARHFI
jgi:hypothetical protein